MWLVEVNIRSNCHNPEWVDLQMAFLCTDCKIEAQAESYFNSLVPRSSEPAFVSWSSGIMCSDIPGHWTDVWGVAHCFVRRLSEPILPHVHCSVAAWSMVAIGCAQLFQECACATPPHILAMFRLVHHRTWSVLPGLSLSYVVPQATNADMRRRGYQWKKRKVLRTIWAVLRQSGTGRWPGSGVQYAVCWWFPQTLVSGRGPSSSPKGSCSPWCASCCTVYGVVVANRYWNPRHRKPFSLGFICGSKHLFSIAMSLTAIIPIHKKEGKCSNFNHTEHNGNKCVTDPLKSIDDGDPLTKIQYIPHF